MSYTGTINASTNPNYPAASAGATYLVTVAGRVGGKDGRAVNVGDVLTALATNSGGTEGSVRTSWGLTPATASTKLGADISLSSMPTIDVDQATIDAILLSAARAGIATIESATTTVSVLTLAAKAAAPIIVTPKAAQTTVPYVSAVDEGVSFTITGEPGDFSWAIFDVQS